jgi:hypothetical protein
MVWYDDDDDADVFGRRPLGLNSENENSRRTRRSVEERFSLSRIRS